MVKSEAVGLIEGQRYDVADSYSRLAKPKDKYAQLFGIMLVEPLPSVLRVPVRPLLAETLPSGGRFGVLYDDGWQGSARGVEVLQHGPRTREFAKIRRARLVQID
jgi:hypothetical protein